MSFGRAKQRCLARLQNLANRQREAASRMETWMQTKRHFLAWLQNLAKRRLHRLSPGWTQAVRMGVLTRTLSDPLYLEPPLLGDRPRSRNGALRQTRHRPTTSTAITTATALGGRPRPRQCPARRRRQLPLCPSPRRAGQATRLAMMGLTVKVMVTTQRLPRVPPQRRLLRKRGVASGKALRRMAGSRQL